jgi:mono/diheme cytochrome c family protein
MAEAIDNGLKYLAPGDIDALVTYVRSVPGIDSHDIARPFAPVASAMPKDGRSSTGGDGPGKQLFESACVSCHGWAGTGAVSRWATLTGARSVNDPSATNVVQVILSGAVWKAADGRAVMPAFGAAYTDDEIAALANYVTARFGAHPSKLVGGDVASLRKDE